MRKNLELRVTGSLDRSFGFVVVAAFTLVALSPMLRHPHQPRWWTFPVAAGFALLAALWPQRLAPHNRLWLRIQHATEEVMLRLTRTAAEETDAKNLRLVGGVALNCVANGKVLRDGRFERIWIQPAGSKSIAHAGLQKRV